jgi:co-chaperonin GroES (HSP10)
MDKIMDNAIQIGQIQAAGDRVVIKQEMDKDYYEVGGIKLVKPENYKNNTTTAIKGVIVNIGKEVKDYKVGDIVLFHKYVGYDLNNIVANGDLQIYKVIPSSEVIAIINDIKVDINEDSLLNVGKLM